MTARDILGSLDVLLDHLVIGTTGEQDGARGAQYEGFAFSRAYAVLRSDEDERARHRFETRLRLALHLAPRSAVDYQRSNPAPRWRLIRDHLVSNLGRDRHECEPLAREIATLLDNWERNRAEVTGHRSFLLHRDGPFCQNCHVEFDTHPYSLMHRDLFKPYFESPEELLSIEVDHREAVSGLGTNVVENLQLLCRLCNAGKGDGLGVDVRQEARFAGTEISKIPLAHRCRIFYSVVDRDRRVCTLCASDVEELTIRSIVPSGAYVRSNLYTLCVGCA
jgi:5-methylcytosine-specific restriction endonuclease McrA